MFRDYNFLSFKKNFFLKINFSVHCVIDSVCVIGTPLM